MQCPNCGTPNAGPGHFCTACGAKLPVPSANKSHDSASVTAGFSNILGERVLLESDGKTLCLTSHRVRYHSRAFGQTLILSIMLEEMASCGVVYTSSPILLVIGGLSLLGAFALQARTLLGIALLVVGGLSFLAFFLARRSVLSIASAGDTIRVPTTGMSTEDAIRFIDAAEAAKHALVASLHEAQNS